MRKKNNIRMTKIVLAISFIILFGRLIYTAIGAYSHQQDKKNPQVEHSITTSPASSTSP